MMRFRRVRAAFAALVAFPLLAAAPAPPVNLHANGEIVVDTNLQGAALVVGAHIGFYRSGGRYRIDFLSFGFPGTSATASAAAGSFLPPGGITAIYDGASSMLTLYSTVNRTYYRDKAHFSPAPVASSPPATAASPAPADPLAMVQQAATSLANVQAFSLTLVGHSTIDGHPVSTFDLIVKRQPPGKPLEDNHATISFAEDLGGMPIRILVSSNQPTGSMSKMRLDLTDATLAPVGDDVFRVPDGYTRVDSFGEVFRPR
jgi:hypothetical protein